MGFTDRLKGVTTVTALLVLLGATGARAQSVSETELRDHAAQWLARNPLAAQYHARTGVPLEVERGEFVRLRGSQLPFYLVHLEPCGYILMNSDRRLRPVLGFSLSGQADLEPGADNALYQLLLTRRQRDTRRLAPVGAAAVDGRWDVPSGLRIASDASISTLDSQVIGPLLTTLWSQGNHYNEYCPVAPEAPADLDGRAPVGCVAVAFAQVMKYHEWPWRGRGSFTYDDTEGEITGTHTALLSDRYDWAKMQNEYYAFGHEPDEAAQAVSALMYELGVAAKTNYEPSFASASSVEFAGRMPEHFLYEMPAHLDESSQGQFSEALLNELTEQRPCVASIPGHAFVVDGHMADGTEHFFHVNYGWAGQNDGWYLLDDVQDEAIADVWTGICPMLTAIPLESEYTETGVELRWALPSTRTREVEAVDVLRRIVVSGVYSDPAEDFDAFEITSTSDHVDWVLSPEGFSGACFHKPAGGYGNREYHLTCPYVFRPGPDSRVTFQAKYMLLDDRFSVAISADGGATFSAVWSASSTVQQSWTEVQIPLGAFSGQEVQIRLEYTPDRHYVGGGVWIDDIAVVSAEWYDWSLVQSIEELHAYRAESTVTFEDQAEDFSTFAAASTHRDEDWSLSADGLTGSCFYKPAGGYSNVQYHLTSGRSFQPGPNTWLAFKARYALADDALSVSVSTDGGETFSQVWYLSDTIHDRWTEVQVPLQAFSGERITLRFEYVPGGYYPDGGIWIDDIRLVDITGAEYGDSPVYYAPLADLPDRVNILAYQVRSAGQLHPQSEAFTVSVPQKP